MRTRTIPGAAGGMPEKPCRTAEINRRTLLAGAALACAPLPTVSGALARLVGIHDCSGVSQKFDAAGWYAIGRGAGFGMRVMYAEPDRGGHLPGFIDLSDGPGERVRYSLSPEAFDYACWGQCFTAAEAERRAV